MSIEPVFSYKHGLTPRRLRIICEFIDSHLNEKLTMHHVAKLVSMNAQYLGRAFKRSTGMTISQHIRNRRIHRAQTLLMRLDKSLLEVATEVGMPNQSHFTRVFRQMVGVTPRTFRER